MLPFHSICLKKGQKLKELIYWTSTIKALWLFIRYYSYYKIISTTSHSNFACLADWQTGILLRVMVLQLPVESLNISTDKQTKNIYSMGKMLWIFPGI